MSKEVSLSLMPGKYVAAVSGGVDSMVLMHLLSSQPGADVIIAHFNHGTRSDNAKDEELVVRQAKKYGYKVETGRGRVGLHPSEEALRDARYAFLYKVQDKYGADAIITAHHQDDLIETALINLLRGTGRRGLSAISANEKVIRPLLKYPKSEIISYARQNRLDWHEDSTNKDESYLRNYLRVNILSKMTANQREDFVKNIYKVAKNNENLDKLIAILSHQLFKNDKLDRRTYISLPTDVGREILIHNLRLAGVKNYDKKALDSLDMAIRTAKSGTKHQLAGRTEVVIGRQSVSIRR